MISIHSHRGKTKDIKKKRSNIYSSESDAATKTN